MNAPSDSLDETCLDAGAGTDTCQDGDMVSTCETQNYYANTVSTCNCGSAPPVIWVW